jgi:hypothetical protein
MNETGGTDLEREIVAWREAIRSESNLPEEDLQELEDHLRDELDALRGLRGGGSKGVGAGLGAGAGDAGLTDGEALFIAMKRMGDGRRVGRELARVDADKVWRHFSDPGANRAALARTGGGDVAWVVGAAILAAALGKVPLLFGIRMAGRGFEIYARNLSLFVVPVLMVMYYLRNRFSAGVAATLGAAVLAAGLAVNLYPFRAGGNTLFLVAMHLPLFLWLVFGLAYTGDDWRTVRGPLDFIRFSGELFIYGVLILAGSMVLVMLVVFFFTAIGVRIESFAQEWLALSLLLATPVIAAHLVEKKRSLIENLAPALARIFIPLFLLMMVAFIGAVVVVGDGFLGNRDILIGSDLLLVLVVSMVLYDLSARREPERFSWAHGINLALIFAALVIDCIALYGVAVRLGVWGFSPNKTAALGENLLLLGNLVGLAYAYVRFAKGRASLDGVLRWQVRYLPAYVVWMAFMVFGLPVVFGFR